ncbi:hypothetical protein SCUCBS95973_000722 [Sporothrix curviconia]|uniref:Uncharacterized protein n=1 Tax=Sporothrix curviconia TaxID=1260050 RepID=A0ABP0ASN4_9PEZI
MAFSFVSYEGPDVPQDPGVRTLIRRQAMRDVGLDRRARGGYGQANLHQVPVFVDELVDRSRVVQEAGQVEHAAAQLDGPLETKPKPTKPKGKGKARPKTKTRSLAGVIKSPSPSAPFSASVSVACTSSASLGSSSSQYMLSAPPVLFSSASAAAAANPRLPVSISYPDSATTEQFALLLNLVPLTGLRLGIGKLSSFKSDLLRARDGAGRRGACFRMPSPSSSSAQPPSQDLGNPALAHFITRHYADVPALRYATDCVTAQLRQIRLRSKGMASSSSTPPSYGKDTPLFFYSKALRAVQAALEDDAQRLTEETLCATELLAVFELLNDNVPSWMHHAGGAAQLIQIRGAQRFRASESGTALFQAHIGTTVMDAFLGNKACFLEEEGWKELMRSIIREDPPLVHLQELSMSIWSNIVTGPGKFKAVTDIISAPRPPDQGTREAIISYLLQDRTSLLGWMERAKRVPGLRNEDFEIDAHGIMLPRLLSSSSSEDETAAGGTRGLDRLTRLSLWGTNIMCRILKSRLLVAMAPSRFRALEEECQYLAAKVQSLDRVAGVGDGTGGLLQTAFISQNSWIVQGVVETRAIWADVSGDEEDDGMIDKWKFDAWCKAIGRKIPRPST